MLPAEFEIYAAIAGSIIVLMVLLSIFFLSINISRKRRIKLEREILETYFRSREETLMQVSRDLHDDIGASLSAIQLFNELLQKQMERTDYTAAQTMSEKISLYIKDISERVSDMAWLFRQGNHTVEVLTQKVNKYAIDMGGAKNIGFILKVQPVVLTTPLSLLQQKNCYLICKEAVNNAIKYSGCSSIQMEVSLTASHLHITVWDSGKGFPEINNSPGSGLVNINQRVLEMGGSCTIGNIPDGGVRIAFQVPVSKEYKIAGGV